MSALSQNLCALIWIRRPATSDKSYDCYVCMAATANRIPLNRFYAILKGESEPDTNEMMSIIEYFAVPGITAETLKNKFLYSAKVKEEMRSLLRVNSRRMIAALEPDKVQELANTVGVPMRVVDSWRTNRNHVEDAYIEKFASFFGFADAAEMASSFYFITHPKTAVV